MKTHLLFALLITTLLVPSTFAVDKIYTCINEKGEKVFSIKAQYVSAFYDGMAAVDKTVLVNGDPKTLTGFVDGTGKLVIKPKFEQVYHFSYGVCWVKESDASGYYLINKAGDRLTAETYNEVGYFFEGFCEVYDAEGQMGFVNRQGKLVIPCQYLGTSFSEGLACVMPYNDPVEKYGFIDTTGAVVIPFQYKQAGTSSFENGECRVQINGVTCLINPKGEVVFKPTLTKNTQGFYEGLSASYTNATNRSGWGFYNRDNVWVIKPEYEYVNSFHGGRSIVQKGGKYGVIDTTGKIILPIQYATIFGDPAEDGWYGTEMEMNGEKVYLNAQGEPFTTVPMLYLYPTYGSHLLPYQDPDKKYGFLHKDGTVFLTAQFESATSFRDGKAWIVGDVTNLAYAPGSTDADFVKEYVVGEKIKSRKNGKGEFYPGTIRQVGENYYLVLFDDGTQEWVVYDSLKRPQH
jgi:hypothetical protein